LTCGKDPEQSDDPDGSPGAIEQGDAHILARRLAGAFNDNPVAAVRQTSA
jgi:hypothetical protein